MLLALSRRFPKK